MASPDVTNVDLDAFDDIKYGINVMVDLNWFISSFLGPLFSPQGFLKNPKICDNGYISQQYIEAAFKGFGLTKNELVQILDCYQVSLLLMRMLHVEYLDYKIVCPGCFLTSDNERMKMKLRKFFLLYFFQVITMNLIFFYKIYRVLY